MTNRDTAMLELRLSELETATANLSRFLREPVVAPDSGALEAAPDTTPTQGTDPFWVLEKSVDGRPVYWHGGHAEQWTASIHEAVQFRRKMDAERSQWYLLSPPRWGWQVVEHAMMAPRPVQATNGASLPEPDNQVTSEGATDVIN